MTLIQLPIFASELSSATIKRYAMPGVTEGGCSLLTCDIHRPGTPAPKVFSTVLFVFPGRMHGLGKFPGGYLTRVEGYLRGFRAAVRNMRLFPGWRYRLYVDRSDVLSDAHNAARTIMEAIDDMIHAHPQDIEVIGVRYVPGHAHPSFADGETFLPAMWRYLPLADARVNVMYAVDSDTPPLPFGVGYAETVAQNAQLMITSMTDYATPWCVLYVGTHLDEGDGVSKHAVCPLGQAWCARRVNGSRLFSTETVNAMLALTGDRVAQQLFAGLDEVGVKKYMDHVAARLRETNVASLEGAVDCAIEVAQKTPQLRDLKMRRRMAALLALLASSQDGVQRLLQGHADITKKLFVSLTSDVDATIKVIGRVITRLDYGVDEFVLQVALCMVDHHDAHVRFLRASTPEAGVNSVNASLPQVRSITHAMLRHPVVGGALSSLHRRVRVQQATPQMKARLMWVKLTFRTGVLLSWLRPLDRDDDVMPMYTAFAIGYKDRVRAMLRPPATDAELQRVFSRRALRAYRQTCDDRIIKIDTTLLQQWTARQDTARRARYDPRRRGFTYDGSVATFRAVVDVLVRCFMMEIPLLYSRIPIEEPVRSWWI